METLLSYVPTYAPMGISVVAVIVSILAWHKNRVIYEIVAEDDRPSDADNLGKVNKLLNTGRYTILHVKPDEINRAKTIYVLGRIKRTKTQV